MMALEGRTKYIIITPAHNEQEFIANTIDSVVAQTLKPSMWIIVNDGSTDMTGDIVRSYLEQHQFITLVNLVRKGDRSFAKKAIAFGRGLAEIRSLNYQFIGNLDADILLEPDYFEKLLQEFNKDASLGVGGGIVYHKIGNRFLTSDINTGSVGGAVQLFRRSCFEAIGGYEPLECGGIDAAAEIKARMLGWGVKKFPEYRVVEQRGTGSAQARPLRARIVLGHRFYSLGYTLLFYLARCLYRCNDPPFLVGSMAELYGYMQSMIQRRPIALSQEVVSYLREEQRQQLRQLRQRLLNIKVGRDKAR